MMGHPNERKDTYLPAKRDQSPGKGRSLGKHPRGAIITHFDGVQFSPSCVACHICRPEVIVISVTSRNSGQRCKGGYICLGLLQFRPYRVSVGSEDGQDENSIVYKRGVCRVGQGRGSVAAFVIRYTSLTDHSCH